MTPPPFSADTLNPSPSLHPGWLVVYRDRTGRLCGGVDDRAHGTVDRCEWDGRSWIVMLTDGARLPAFKILSIGQTDQAGNVICAWNVREHGLDGNAGRAPADLDQPATFPLTPGDFVEWTSGGQKREGFVDFLHFDQEGKEWAFLSWGATWAAVNVKFLAKVVNP